MNYRSRTVSRLAAPRTKTEGYGSLTSVQRIGSEVWIRRPARLRNSKFLIGERPRFTRRCLRRMAQYGCRKLVRTSWESGIPRRERLPNIRMDLGTRAEASTLA